MEPFDELTVRRERLDQLQKERIDAYPSTTNQTHSIEAIIAQYDELVAAKSSVVLVGRIMALRGHGGSTFLNLYDGTARLQVYFKKDEVGEGYKQVELLDVADFIEVTGTLFSTHRGEKTLLASLAPRLLAKALRPLPEKWHGLVDVETRYRKRYLDFLVNDESRSVATTRAAIIQAARKFFDDKDFLEVDTPILQTVPGGATARPFMTHWNSLDIDVYLRVAPELYLKRLLVGGFPKIYEVARCFRNEGMDHTHNPEFTQIELYQAYCDYRGLMSMLEEFMVAIATKITAGLRVTYDGSDIDLTPPYKVVDWMETLQNALGEDLENLREEELRTLLLKKNIDISSHDGKGSMLDAAYKKYVRPNIIQPTFFIDHPIELSPLAKRHPTKPNRVERFQLVLGGGIELMNGFSELNDPLDQRKRFEDQERLRSLGDDEAQRIDEEYLEALEHGMPPAAGVGFGVDRLVQLFTNQHSLKEVLLFPTLRPRTAL